MKSTAWCTFHSETLEIYQHIREMQNRSTSDKLIKLRNIFSSGHKRGQAQSLCNIFEECTAKFQSLLNVHAGENERTHTRLKNVLVTKLTYKYYPYCEKAWAGMYVCCISFARRLAGVSLSHSDWPALFFPFFFHIDIFKIIYCWSQFWMPGIEIKCPIQMTHLT